MGRSRKPAPASKDVSPAKPSTSSKFTTPRKQKCQTPAATLAASPASSSANSPTTALTTTPSSSPTTSLATSPASSPQAAAKSVTIDTFFPKIELGLGKIINRYNTVHRRLDPKTKFREVKPFLLKKPSPVIQLVGTVKLHGIHADLVVGFDDTIRLQSRNQPSLSLNNDIFDVAGTLLSLGRDILNLRDQFVQRYRELNPGVDIDQTYPVIIAGEWVGPGIQKGVALDSLPGKGFVIISANINNTWVSDKEYGDIQKLDLHIINISRGGCQVVDVVIDDWKKAEEEMTRLTLEVEKECPFTRTFLGKDGKAISGIGEGIVWKVVGELGADPKFWVKTKGPLHREVATEKLPSSTDPNDLTKAIEFAKATVLPDRLDKGMLWIKEWCAVKDRKMDTSVTGEYLTWLKNDILVETADVMKELGINWELTKKEIGMIGKLWFQMKIRGY